MKTSTMPARTTLRLAPPRARVTIAASTAKKEQGNKKLEELRAKRKEAEAKRSGQLRKIAQKIDEVARDEVSNLTNTFANLRKGAKTTHHDGSIDIDFSGSDSD